ncbi:colicin V production protein [Rothia nasimurium]|uniref:Colicin V production protein n=1 Tax=Rothia nasimurium TaxID=85336 RepID=A0A1Y1RNK4_9MICC|nr:MarP family serine protease [Rothia nasimurium]ORC16417.1 colicin V production protein [Rothia nasimurium]
MTVLDWVIIAIIVLYFLAGLRQGLFVTLGTFVGFVLGAVAALYATPWVISQVDSQWYLLAGLGTLLGCLVLGQTLGMTLGSAIRKASDRTPLRGLERLAGGLLNMVLAALVIITVVLVVRPLGIPAVTALTADSKVVTWMMQVTPVSAQEKVTEIRGQIVQATGLPEISQLLYPEQAAPTETLATSALEEASWSVVQVLGAAQACSYTSEGSGFVVDSDLVVTNAHVVAGVSTPSVLARDGQAATGEVVYFDAERDIAIISAPSLNVNPLPVNQAEVATGTTVAFMGYPGGGPYESRPATVQGLGYTQTVNAKTGETNPSRLVYQLAANVQQGNSGGPVLTDDGQVMGMVFAKSTQSQTGYAVPSSQIAEALAQVNAGSPAVATGQCASN